MDISRLPSAPYARPVTASQNTGARVDVTSAAGAVGAAGEGRPSPSERPDRIVQGELLDRQRDNYQSTRAFVNERRLDQSRPAGQPGPSALLSRSAIFQYANNTRPESVADFTQGRSINFFV